MTFEIFFIKYNIIINLIEKYY